MADTSMNTSKIPQGWIHIVDALLTALPHAKVRIISGHLEVFEAEGDYVMLAKALSFRTCQICGANGVFGYHRHGGGAVKIPGPRCSAHRGWLDVIDAQD